MEAIQNATLEGTQEEDELIAGVDLSNVEISEDFLPEVDYSDVPRDSASKDYMESERALVRYELGNVLFLSMERPDSAASWYRLVIDETGSLPVAQRAYYALAEVQRALGDQGSAERLYREVLDRYPDSDFANQVRERLGLPLQQVEVSDSLALAEAAYREAYRMWQQQNYEQAVTDMVMIAANYPVPEMTPRALLATGTIYLEWAEREELDIYALPPPSVPDSVLLNQGLVDSTFISQGAFERIPNNEAPGEATAEMYDYGSDDNFVAASQNIFAADSLRRLSDVLLNRSDSLYVVSDSYYGQGDSLQLVSDSLYSLSEQLQLESDRLFIDADSMQAQGERSFAELGHGVIPMDSLRQLLATNSTVERSTRPFVVRGKHLKLDKLYATVKDRFPRTEHATYADQMLRALVEMRPPQDSTVVEALAQEDFERAVEEMSDEERYMKGPGGVDTSAVGWTLVVASFSVQERADVLRQEYEAKGFRAGVVKGSTRFRVCVGQFPGLDEARAGLAAYKEELPPTAWFLDLQKPK